MSSLEYIKDFFLLNPVLPSLNPVNFNVFTPTNSSFLVSWCYFGISESCSRDFFHRFSQSLSLNFFRRSFQNFSNASSGISLSCFWGVAYLSLFVFFRFLAKFIQGFPEGLPNFYVESWNLEKSYFLSGFLFEIFGVSP